MVEIESVFGFVVSIEIYLFLFWVVDIDLISECAIEVGFISGSDRN